MTNHRNGVKQWFIAHVEETETDFQEGCGHQGRREGAEAVGKDTALTHEPSESDASHLFTHSTGETSWENHPNETFDHWMLQNLWSLGW